MNDLPLGERDRLTHEIDKRVEKKWMREEWEQKDAEYEKIDQVDGRKTERKKE